MNPLNVNIEKYNLKNGLEVILLNDDRIPLVGVNLWYNVGSANEERDKTGFAHLFEHIMFQGSMNVPKEMHFKYIQEAGGNLNGSTSTDRTNYYETVPANFLEMILWLESDRMGFLLPAIDQEKLNNQIDVVRNERLQRYDNVPYGLSFEKLFSSLYPDTHPYHSPVIGWMEDIMKMELDDVKKFFTGYYNPSNATIVVGGKHDSYKTKELIEKYFGEIPSNGRTKLVIEAPELFDLTESKKVIHYDKIQLPRLYIAWPTVKAFSKNEASLEILAELLGGSKNARIYKKLVVEEQIAQQVSVFQHSGKYGGTFIIIATSKPGISLEKLKAEIFHQINDVIQNGIEQKELTRIKNGIKSSFIYSMQNLDNVLDRLNEYNFYLGEPDSFEYDLNRFKNVSAEDVKNAASYLQNNFVELHVMPNDK
ncbi:MAG: insulinase family protein [Ignavibacteriales bacterium]|nr:MAG: insulinase family protein [Ignavibacteriales bacterium]